MQNAAYRPLAALLMDFFTEFEAKNVLMSCTNTSAHSRDEKWPPTSYSLQYWMLAACCAQSLGHWRRRGKEMVSCLCSRVLLRLTYMQLFFGIHADASRAPNVSLKSLLCLSSRTKGFTVEPQTGCGALDPMHDNEGYRCLGVKSFMDVTPVMEFLNEPRQQTSWRVAQRKSQRLRPGSLLLKIAALVYLKIPPHPYGLPLKVGIEDAREAPSKVGHGRRPQRGRRHGEHVQVLSANQRGELDRDGPGDERSKVAALGHEPFVPENLGHEDFVRPGRDLGPDS